MNKNNNKKTFWFLGIFIFSALAILAVLSFLAFFNKENPGNNFLNVSSINNANTNKVSENTDENNDYFLLKNDKNGETIVAITQDSKWSPSCGYTTPKQNLNNSDIPLILPYEIISYGENNSQLIYTFCDKEQYEKCQTQNKNNNECPLIRKFFSYNTETGERKIILEKYAKKDEFEKQYMQLNKLKIVNNYLYILEEQISDGGMSFVSPDERILRIDLNNPRNHEYLNNGEIIGWMQTYKNKIYFIDSESDIYFDGIKKIISYDDENNTLKTLWEVTDNEYLTTCGEGFFYKNEYILATINKNGIMQINGIDLETGKFRLISESKEKFIDSNNKPATEGGAAAAFDNYSKIIFSYEYPPTGLNKIYFYDLEKNTWDSMGNPEIRLATDGMDIDKQYVYEILKNNGLDYSNQKTQQVYSLHDSSLFGSPYDDDKFEDLYKR